MPNNVQNIESTAEQGGQVDAMVRHEIPNYIKNCAVTDCNSVDDFAHKYRKAERFTLRGDDYVKAVMRAHNEELNRFGYTCISHHANITGKFISYIEHHTA